MLIFIYLVLVFPCQARIIYIDVNTSDNNDGLSWARAYKYLQDALTDASTNNDVNEIRIAQGIYKPSAYPPGTSLRDATFQLINGVAVIILDNYGFSNYIAKKCPTKYTLLFHF